VRRSLIAIAAALALAGCGTANSASNFTGEQATVAKVIDNLSTDGTGHKASDICNKLFAAALAAKLKTTGTTCDSVIGDRLNDVDIFALTVQSVKIAGKSAVVAVKSTANGKNVTQNVDLMHESDGTWRITAIA
jgi:uncharacterized protein YceK